ncbi:bifunctional 4-hydroxy-2-oxoglutarate aldolase/2-dehydro-3-deoxy-phosphogluconate aldolase [Phaeobacter gallaeciensis]|jgi:2-dehydro-3-deoxyphosphogluconate aldolase/(4S)-4-hydroxy-2-oxoglutarate aldolase|uniref:bifunctional 4-hydroxy-2-oxoglutarate aldolase/2-dehydro-3-deoxy-phosphogluconate aldolase n=1 Tax=Phaeobacter gallaeciensis TaxID=60890 RepID=UPI00237F4A1E|nr:bifunctional 4-hydroxy-2-oxoglutarate aldolase/2-dehydro-3-deoxy-phosphogluconate aldolase [Phaeobacter gallaeciensis]MDE4306179.1 bifunctional 4-hydroxy-2-oxoglutarate aldolase/2-dehydro-3-deoxy-phosphogluconate aldolase [Phaeobacter gallaeciensis]MDE4310645.1 bifunctional 4-hydroxy-2-oxoglutarate aldolase/2-dehydro-3-deoxy-phosphogluconate aldolase [Phaeobacter gallaeciensis]MDE4314635.1 bifunctional 4-hydroxy-2-oxoglutarate aldolase/2-dehydro-3-deoxy-phosphogluconate aldolase [Phaeobacter 
MVAMIEKLRAARIVPVIRYADPAIAMKSCELLAQAGIRALEITTTVPSAAEMIADLKRRFPSVATGAGTVFTEKQAGDVLKAGADFVVSPCWSDEAATPVLEAGIPYLPGAMTPGEVLHHSGAGAAVVKIFPADAAGGSGFVKALKSIFPDVPLMPTGGVTPGAAQFYLDAGALCVGMGGNLLPAKALEGGDVPLARDQINAALKAVSFQTS